MAVDRETAIATMRGWANQLAARYAAPVWLVGSSLDVADLQEARDLDVRIVLPDREFEARFGVDVATWAREQWSTWSDGSKRWGVEVAKLTRGWMTMFGKPLGLNLDLQIHPAFIARTFWERPRVRLDDLEIEVVDVFA